MSVAMVTGASKGLGRALAEGLAARGWSLVLDARGQADLTAAARHVRRVRTGTARVAALAGDVADEDHRVALVAAAADLGGLDLLVNNASTLGVSPLPALADYPLVVWRQVFEVDVVAPLALVQLALPLLRQRAHPRLLAVTSDAAAEAYAGWGAYGSAKAALEQMSAVLAVEEPGLSVWVVDPGDMRTQMHQDAYPGEDISDRPPAEDVVPALLSLIESDRPSGRYRAADLDGALPVGTAAP